MGQREQNFNGVEVRSEIYAPNALTTLGRSVQSLTDTAVSYSAADTDPGVNVTSTASARTVTLPTAVGKTGQLFSVLDGSNAAGTNNITVDGFGSETINDNATVVISKNGGGVVLRSNGTNWIMAADFSSPSVGSQLTPLVTTPVGTVAVTEYGDGKDMVTILTLTDFIVGALAGAGAALGVGNIVAAFPAGQHFELVYSLSTVALKCAGTAVATDTGLGSVIASGAVSVLSGTATFEDRLTGQTITTGTAYGTAVNALTAATAGIGTGIALNVAASVKNIFLNSSGTWNSNNTGNLLAQGVIVLKWTKMS